MEATINTRDKILEVASDIFYKKGLAGARMHEIANQVGINKAMLHYYFNTKEQLFKQVFEKAFGLFVGRIAELLNGNSSLKSKISDYIDYTIDSLQQNPGITIFVLQELSINPEWITELFAGKGNIDFSIFKNQVKAEFDGKMDAEMLFTDMVALCVYPFIAHSIFKKLLSKNDYEFKDFLQDRKFWIKKIVLKGI